MSPLDLNEERDVRTKAMLLGHIRLGIFAGGRPQASEAFVFTSSDRLRLEPLAKDFGGTVEPYEAQGAGTDSWRLRSEADAFTALFPFADSDANMTQDWMLWSRSGLKRRCDGFNCSVLTYDEETGEISEEESACICRAKGQDRKRECDPETRLRFLLPQTGLGIWELVTHSKIAALDLYDQVQFIASIAEGRMNHLPIRVVYGPREIHYVDEKDGKRHSTTKRLVALSVAGDAGRALTALAAPPNRALISAVETALADSGRELVGISAPELEAGDEASSPEASPAYGEGVSGSEGEETSGESAAETTGLGDAPAPSGDEPAPASQWKVAKDRKLTSAKVLKLVNERFHADQPLRDASLVTQRELEVVIKETFGP